VLDVQGDYCFFLHNLATVLLCNNNHDQHKYLWARHHSFEGIVARDKKKSKSSGDFAICYAFTGRVGVKMPFVYK
jgi:hypothetical protein